MKDLLLVTHSSQGELFNTESVEIISITVCLCVCVRRAPSAGAADGPAPLITPVNFVITRVYGICRNEVELTRSVSFQSPFPLDILHVNCVEWLSALFFL